MSSFQVCDYWHDHVDGDPSYDDCQAAAAATRLRLMEARLTEEGRALAADIHTRSDWRRCEKHQRSEHFTAACPICGRTNQSALAHVGCLRVQDPLTFEAMCERDRARLRRRVYR